MTKKLLSIVVPAFNEEKNIAVFYETLLRILQKDLQEFAYEIVFIDDGSRDHTLIEIKKLAQRDANVRAIALSRNFGHQAALTAGLTECHGDIIVSMDCDLQDPPEVVAQMVKKWQEGFKIVYARRKERVDGFFKKYTAILYYKFLSTVSTVEIPRDVGDFRLVDRIVLKYLLEMNEQARYLRGMVAWLGFKYAFVDFSRPERVHGETHYTLRKMIQLAMDGILNFSFLPLRLGFLLGVFTILIAIFFTAYMLIDAVANDIQYPLYKWLTVVLFGFMGLQFIFLWVMGEYIGRIYDDVRRRHIYVINERINFEKQ